MDENHIIQVMSEVGILIPKISQLNITNFKPGHQYFEHSYESEMEIILALQVSCYILIGGQCIKLRQHEYLVIAPGVVHNFYLKKNESSRIYDLIINIGKFPHFTRLPQVKIDLSLLYCLEKREMNYFKAFDECRLQNTLEEMHHYFMHKTDISQNLLKLYACELYLKLSEVLNENHNILNKDQDTYVEKAKGYIRDNFNSKLILEDVARASGITARHLSRLFSKECGMTVQDYITVLKINKAKELLENTEIDITGIAFSLGFCTSDYFSTFFKKHENISPSTYRKLRGTKA